MRPPTVAAKAKAPGPTTDQRAARPRMALREDIHGTGDHEGDSRDRDKRLRHHGDLGPTAQRQNVRWAEGRRVGKRNVEVVDKGGLPVGRSQLRARHLWKEEV